MASANNLGTAYIKIAPQMQGIQKSISDGLAGIKSTSLPGAAALGTVIAKGVSAAMNLVTSSLDDAIKRTDVINNFPKVMSNIGIGADAAQESIDTLKQKLDGLPTSLQAGAMAVQRFTSKNSDIKKSTDLFLALNNAILAGGAPAEIQATAIEQMSQAYAKGKPDMMEWRAIQSAMPAQLRQISIAMGYGADGVAELGEALRHNEVSMDDFMGTIVKLNKEGANGFQSFEKQAKNSTDGIGTALTNVKNRAAAAIQQVIQSFGSKDVSDAINKFSSSFTGIATWISNNIIPIVKNQLVPVLKGVLSVVKGIVEFIAQNKWIQNTLMGIVGAMLAFKAVNTVKSAIAGIISPIANVASGIGNFIGKFVEAKAAGMTFGESLQWVNQSASGLGKTLTNAHGAVGGFTSKLFGISAAAGAVVLAVKGVEAMIEINKIQTIEATTAARDYAREHYNLEQAAKSAQRAEELLTASIRDLQTAQDAATDAEIRQIQAQQDQAHYQEEMNRLKEQGKENTNEYRLAELNYTKAIADEKKATDELTAAKQNIANTEKEIDDLNSSKLYKANLVIGKLMEEKGAYGNLASQLDALKEKTITYKDANGNMVTASIEKSQEMVTGLAEQLAQGSEVWRAIVDKANTEGISFSEACAKYGEESGQNLMGNFKTSAEMNLPLLSTTGQEAIDTIKNAVGGLPKEGQVQGKGWLSEMISGARAKLKDLVETGRNVASSAVDSAKSASNAYGVGQNLSASMGNGIVDPKTSSDVFAQARSIIRNAINAMKDQAKIHSPSKVTAELGRFMSMGLANGIDDYADEAVKAAEDMTDRTLEAMNKTGSFDGLIQSQVQPQTGLVGDAEGAGNKVIQNNTFEVNSELDVKEISKRLGWQVATAL